MNILKDYIEVNSLVKAKDPDFNFQTPMIKLWNLHGISGSLSQSFSLDSYSKFGQTRLFNLFTLLEVFLQHLYNDWQDVPKQDDLYSYWLIFTYWTVCNKDFP